MLDFMIRYILICMFIYIYISLLIARLSDCFLIFHFPALHLQSLIELKSSSALPVSLVCSLSASVVTLQGDNNSLD